MPRLQNWFDSFNEAKKAASERKEHKHKVAKMTKKHNGEVVGYYVGQLRHIHNLKERYDIRLY
jgi:hypothetical protein